MSRWRRFRARWLPTRWLRRSDFAWPRIPGDDREVDDIVPTRENTTRKEWL